MHAIICQGDGKYYVSAVFAHYEDVDESEKSKKYFRYFYKSSWVVWDEKRERLISVSDTGDDATPVLIVDSDQSNWNADKDGVGCVSFLDRILIDWLLMEENQPEYILEACRESDAGYEYAEIREIRTQKDIKDLDCIVNGFCDAFVIKEELQDDGTLYLLVDGMNDCMVELWFSGDLEYDTSRLEPEYMNPTWISSTILFHDGFVYFADMYNLTIENIMKEPNWIKARHMKYRIIPD